MSLARTPTLQKKNFHEPNQENFQNPKRFHNYYDLSLKTTLRIQWQTKPRLSCSPRKTRRSRTTLAAQRRPTTEAETKVLDLHLGAVKRNPMPLRLQLIPARTPRRAQIIRKTISVARIKEEAAVVLTGRGHRVKVPLLLRIILVLQLQLPLLSRVKLCPPSRESLQI